MERLISKWRRFSGRLAEIWENTPKSFKIGSKFLKWLLIITILYFAIYGVFAKFYIEEPIESSLSLGDSSEVSEEDELDLEDCNVLGINLHGIVSTFYSEDYFEEQQTTADEVTFFMKESLEEDDIKAIVVEIDSYGGSGVAGEEMMRAFQGSTKPVVAFIRDAGLSAAYLAATGADTIFASNFSDVGSIGVTMSYLDNTGKNTKEGLTYIDLSSGKYKDTGDPDKPLTTDERQLLMRDVNIASEYFIKLVSENRGLSIEKVRALADGSSVMGAQALKDGLIDHIGALPDVEKLLAEQIGEPLEICWP